MAANGKKSKAVDNEAREVIRRVNCLCKQEAVEKILILPPFATAKHCGVRVTLRKRISTEGKETNDEVVTIP
jgi:hypothetical protein